MIELANIYRMDDAAEVARALYQHLAERTPEQSISHRTMPTYEDHVAFVGRQPYRVWYFVMNGKEIVGNIYLTKHNEVGIHIVARCRGQGYGHAALEELRRMHPGRMLANINPLNRASIAFFKQHGATLLQYTYEL